MTAPAVLEGGRRGFMDAKSAASPQPPVVAACCCPLGGAGGEKQAS